MSRIRSIHPGLWTDDAFMALSAHARLLIIGIWTEAFDDGAFEWKPLTLKARIFPADMVDVPALLDELVSGDFIRQEESNGRRIGLVRNFREYQRPKKPNTSGLLKPEWGSYVGLPQCAAEAVPDQLPTSSEKSPQMEDGGGEEDEDTSPPPVLVAEGARDLFGELWEVFPRNPTSLEPKAEAAFSATKAGDRDAILAAARRYRLWFIEDCKARDRTEDAGARFVPHLSKWIEDGAWRSAEKLAVKADAPVVPMIRLDQSLDPELWAACEKLRGKQTPTSPWSFEASLVERARASLSSGNEAVH